MNMFARKAKAINSQTTADESSRKKFASKILDAKKEVNGRLKYLKIFIESSDNVVELKQFFDNNYSQIFLIFYESFINLETNLKQKLSKFNKEEFETVLFVFQKILVLQPERIHQRWQVRSIGRTLQKLLHIGNAKFIKINGLRLFLIWYQILNVNRTHVEELMFQKLIQGFDTLFHSSLVQISGQGGSIAGLDMLNAEAHKVFASFEGGPNSAMGGVGGASSSSSSSPAHATGAHALARSIYAYEIAPLLPMNPNSADMLMQQQQSQSGQQNAATSSVSGSISSASGSTAAGASEGGLMMASQQQLFGSAASQQPTTVYGLTAELLRNMLDFMQHDCLTIEWQTDKMGQSLKCYEFLFDEFKRFYLAYMFPSAFLNTTGTTTNTNTSSNTASSNVNNTPNTSFRSNSLTGSTPATPQSVAHPINHSHLSHHALNVYSNFDLLGILQESANALSLSGSLSSGGVNNVNDDKKQTQLHCKEEIIRWLVGVLVIDQIPPSVNNQQTVTTSSSISAGLSSGATTPSGGDQFYSSFSSSTLNSLGASAASDLNLSISSKSRFNDADSLRASQDTFMLNDYDSNYSSDLQSTGGGTVSSITSSTTTITNFTLPSNTSSAASKLLINKQLIQRVILSTPNNVNLVHEILRNAYFLNFDDNLTIKLVLDAHKKWFLKEAKMPSFMLEPPPQLQALNQQQHQSDQQQQQHHYSNILDTSMQSSDAVSIHTSSEVPNTAVTEDAMSTTTSSGLLLPTYPRTSSVSSTSSALSASSVAAAIANIDPVLLTRIGYAKSLQIFFYHSSNLLLNRNNLHKDKIKNVSCYVLEIYKMFIRKIKMDHYTWTLLITILLRVSEFLFNSEFLINNRNDPASSQLIKIITETMLLSMIKSSFCFNMSNDLWDQLMNMLAMVNSNPDVIDKWMESIDDLIRQVIKYCYGVDINNLPINESTTDQKRKIKKKNVYNGVPAATTTPSSQNGLPVIKGSVGGAPNQQQTQPPQQQPVFRQPQQTASNMLTKPRSRTEIYHPASQPTINPSTLSAAAAAAAAAVAANSTAASSIATVNSSPSAAQHHHHQHKAPTIRESGSVSAAVANIPPQTPTTPAFQHAQQAPSTALVNRQRTMTAAEIETTKSPSLSDEHFISSVDQTGGSQTPTTSNKAASVSPRQQTSKPGGETTSGVTTDYDEEYDENDDEAFDRSATLKAVTVNTTTSNGGYNSTVFFAPGATSPVSTAAAAARLLSDGEASSSNEKMINRFNSDKSIYYSSEHLAETAVSNTSSNLDESNSSATATSPSNQQQQQKQAVPPPLPPLPTNLSSKYNRYINAMATSVSGESGGQATNLQPPPLPLTSPPSLTPTTPATQQLLISTFETNDQVDAAAANALHHGAGFNEQRKLKGLSMLSADLELAGTGGGGGFTSSEEGEMSGNDTTNYASPNNISVNATNPAATTTTNTTISSTASSQLSETVISNTAAQLDSTSGNSSGSSSNTGLLATATATTVDRSSVERSASFITNSGGGNDATLKPQRAVDKPPAQSTAITTTFRDISLMLIKRLFGCLGNVNSIKDPIVHRRVLEFILAKWERLARVKDELRLKDLTQIVMPASYFAPWLFEAVYQLPASYQSGKLIAYKTLCHIIIRSAQAHTSLNYYYYDIQQLNGDFDSIDDEFIDLFYLTLHQGFVSNDRNVINCLIQNTGTKFWHCMLPSSTLLLKDFIDACCLVDSQGPKYEAASILGCLICFADFFGDMKVLSNGTQSTIASSSSSPSSSLSPSASLTTSPNTSGGQQPQQISPSSNKSPSSQKPTDSSGLIVENASKDEIKNLIIQSLVAFNDDYFNNNSRCVILCALTCFIYDEILNQRWNIKRLNEAIKRIFKDLDFRDQFNPVLVKMSCDNLRFLSCLAHLIFQKDIQYAIDIINVLNQCLVKLINTKPTILNEDYEKAIIANMFALLEWCMNMPLEQLKDHDRATLLRNNFKLIIHISNTFKPNESIEAEHIHLSAKFIITHLLNQLNHFPFGYSGAAKIVSSVNEISDLGLNLDDLSPQLFDQSNIQFFTINNQFLVSFVELPIKNNEKYFSISPRLKVSSSACRFIVRDFSGKYCWDSCVLTTPDDTLPNSYFLDIPFKNRPKFTVELPGVSTSPHSDTNSTFDYTEFANLSHENIPKDIDLLDNVLMYINYSSPECRFEPNRPLNIVWELNANTNAQLNVDEVKNKLSNQSVTEQKHVIEQHEDEMNELEEKKDNFVPPKEKQQQQSQSTSNDSNLQYYYHLCKSFVHEMGLLSWEKRQSFNLLHKSAQLLRELKSLDDQTCRETHKIALIYIGEGQEERSTILSNECGSKDYEDFLAALAWPVDLETHEGFMGGLQHNYQIKTAPYYANSICEVLFHVSTQMNNENDQNKISKWRHLGNDSVQIIWSEHTRDYDRNILATEFADVIICIYPLRNGLFRIQIIKKPSVGYFGPLFDGAIVNKQTLPTLIRATAVNASRVLLSNTKGYQDFFVHRAHALNNIIKTQTEKQTFEQFIVDIYSPASINPASTQISSSSNYQQPTVSTHPSSSSINLKAKESAINADSNTTTTNTNSTDSYVK